MKVHNCSKCGETDPGKFYGESKSKCKSCSNKEQVIAHRLNPEYSKKQAIYYSRWYAERGRKRSPNYQDVIILWQATHQDEIKARRKVIKAIKQGLLDRPLKCSMCGRERCRINGHHNDYDFPYDVMWLCSSCHKKLHLENRA